MYRVSLLAAEGKGNFKAPPWLVVLCVQKTDNDIHSDMSSQAQGLQPPHRTVGQKP